MYFFVASCDLLLKLLLLSAARANVRDTATTTMITENSTYSAYFIIATNFESSHKGFIYVRHTIEDILPNGPCSFFEKVYTELVSSKSIVYLCMFYVNFLETDLLLLSYKPFLMIQLKFNQTNKILKINITL